MTSGAPWAEQQAVCDETDRRAGGRAAGKGAPRRGCGCEASYRLQWRGQDWVALTLTLTVCHQGWLWRGPSSVARKNDECQALGARATQTVGRRGCTDNHGSGSSSTLSKDMPFASRHARLIHGASCTPPTRLDSTPPIQTCLCQPTRARGNPPVTASLARATHKHTSRACFRLCNHRGRNNGLGPRGGRG